jgi:CheY-like chemotaxis protein
MARILIVDDDAAFRGSLAETVGDLGHEVLEAGSTAAGLTLLAAHAVDAAIVDLRMPDEDGLVFLQRAPAIAAIPCIMLTAYASGDNTIEAIRLGPSITSPNRCRVRPGGDPGTRLAPEYGRRPIPAARRMQAAANAMQLVGRQRSHAPGLQADRACCHQ